MIFAKLALDSVGRVQATNATPSGAFSLNGAAYMQEGGSTTAYPCITTDSVAASDGFIGGFRYTTAGALRVSDVSGGLPASSSVNQGLLMTDDGQLCFSTAAGTAVLNGVSVTADGAVSMSIMAFLLEFEDLGAGAVDTAVTFGGVTPTFTRATTATTIGPTGLVISVASGVARSYYDPTSLAYLGYLAEGARTNLMLSSEDFRSAAAGNPITAWTNTDTTVTVAGTIAPDGSGNGNLLTEGTAGTSLVAQSVTATADVNYSASIFFKRGNHDWVRFVVVNGANFYGKYFNVATGAVGTTTTGGTGAFVSASTQTFPNGWFRLTIVGSVGSAATAISTLTASAVSDNNATRVNNGTRYQWGAQFENNVSFASSYIPTTTAAVTRNADVLTYPTTGWLNASAGTMYTEVTPSAGTAPSNQYSASMSDGTTNEVFGLRHSSGTASFQAIIVDGGAGVATLTVANAYSSGVLQKQVAAWAVNDAIAAAGGTLSSPDTSVSLPTVTTLYAGGLNGSDGFAAFNPIRRVAYYPFRLPNAVLQRLTA